jgi:hypothetical protein
MQNSYVHNAGQWHLVNGTYAHHQGQWHLVENAYIHYNGQWHLAQSAGSNLDQVYDTPGNFTYKVPDGVYNIELSYPTPTGITSFKINNVTPGQEIPITIGEYGTTSSVVVSTSTSYILPAFDIPVLSLVTYVDGWLIVEFSVTSPTGTAVISSSDNVGAAAAATAAGALYTIEYEGYQGSGNTTMSLSPVKTEYITNWPRARVLESRWGGRNNIRTSGPLVAKGNYYTYKFSQNDDPQKGYGSYTYVYNLQQILKLKISPSSPATAGTGVLISPSSFITNAIVGTTFSQSFSASGGTGPYTWSASTGTINSSGLLTISSGTLSSAGTLSVTITATSANSLTGTIQPTLNISAGDGTDSSGIPMVYSVSPNTGTSAGGQLVTISGINFTDATAATIGVGLYISNLTVLNDTTITGNTAASVSTGTVNVTVINALGSGTGNGLFTYT